MSNMSSEKQTTTDKCGICLDAMTDPVITLPCKHRFCAECLNSWKPKYAGVYGGGGDRNVEADLNRKCPLCRENLPPSRKMISLLNSLRLLKSVCEDSGDYYSSNYTQITAELEILETEIGEWDGETVLESVDVVELPKYVAEAAMKNDIGKVTRWLKQVPGRVNAECPFHVNDSLLHRAAMRGHCDIINILLQEGANVNTKNAMGAPPVCISRGKYIDATLLLYQWGAELDEDTRKCLQHDLRELGQHDAGMLLKSELGGRRCEIVNDGSDLTGKTCIADGYLLAVEQYAITVEFTNEKRTTSPRHLRRRDRTPEDPGYYVEFENGRTIRRDFESNGECQAYVASIKKEDEVPVAVSAEAEAGADKAMEDLLAELGLEEPSPTKSAKNEVGKRGDGKKKGKSKKKKGKK